MGGAQYLFCFGHPFTDASLGNNIWPNMLGGFDDAAHQLFIEVDSTRKINPIPINSRPESKVVQSTAAAGLATAPSLDDLLGSLHRSLFVFGGGIGKKQNVISFPARKPSSSMCVSALKRRVTVFRSSSVRPA